MRSNQGGKGQEQPPRGWLWGGVGEKKPEVQMIPVFWTATGDARGELFLTHQFLDKSPEFRFGERITERDVKQNIKKLYPKENGHWRGARGDLGEGEDPWAPHQGSREEKTEDQKGGREPTRKLRVGSRFRKRQEAVGQQLMNGKID